MKKFDFKNVKLRVASVDELDDRLLLINLYLTQGLTFIIGLCWILLQGRNPLKVLELPADWQFALWGAGFAAIVVAVDLIVSRFAPDEAADDGGINERMFRGRAWWHLIVICFVVSICEELLFRGAIQHAIGPYWTSILFAAIHVRYLKHWIPTGLVFLISYGMGWMMIWTGTIWTAIAAHFVIDLVMGCIIKFRRES